MKDCNVYHLLDGEYHFLLKCQLWQDLSVNYLLNHITLYIPVYLNNDSIMIKLQVSMKGITGGNKIDPQLLTFDV